MIRTLQAFALSLSRATGNAVARETDEPLPARRQDQQGRGPPRARELKNPFEYRQLLFTGVLDTGDRVDLTRLAQFTAPAKSSRCRRAARCGPPATAPDGIAYVVRARREHPGHGQRPEDEVRRQLRPRRDAGPVASMGCNAGTCHGAAQGKNGFKLSLRGYDPLFDHRALTDDLAGRRFNRAAPDRSLMLLKPAGAVPHVGGVADAAGRAVLRAAQAVDRRGREARPRTRRASPSIEVFPQGPDRAAARHEAADRRPRHLHRRHGPRRDRRGVHREQQHRGRHRRQDRAWSPPSAAARRPCSPATKAPTPPPRSSSWATAPASPGSTRREYNYIDELVYEKLKQVKVLPSDAVHRRRVRPPRLPRPDRPAARRRRRSARSSPTPRPTQGQARRADRQARRQPRLRRALDEQVGRPAAGEPQVPRRRRGATALRNWIRKARRRRTCPTTSSPTSVLTGDRLERREPAGRRTSRSSATPTRRWRTRRTCSWRSASTATSATTIRSSAGRRTSTTSWPRTSPRSAASEDPKFKGQKIGGTAVEGAAAAGRGHRATRSAARSSTTAPAQVAPPTFPFTHADMPPADGRRREQLAKWITVEGEPVLRQELRQPPLELPARRRHHRAGRRHPRRQPADQPGAARPADRGVRRAAASTCSS